MASLVERAVSAVRDGRVVSGLKSRAIVGSKLAFVGSKLAFDFVRPSDVPAFSFERLSDSRFYAYLLTALTHAGTVECPVRDLVRACTWLRPRDFAFKTRPMWDGPTKGTIVLSESQTGPGILHINKRYYSTPPAEHRLFLPYFAHPVFYRNAIHNLIFRMREKERGIRIFFAGTLADRAYSDNFSFPILSRDKILSYVINRFSENISGQPNETDRPIVMSITDDTRDTLKKHKLPLFQYMNTMARSAFFISPPGTLIPHSHNIVEAMSVGAIPITNYHDYMVPRLIPGEHCLAFSTLKELEECIESALRMPEPSIRRIRESVIDHYDKYLDPKSFARRFTESYADCSEIVANDDILH